jgi:hypothetical protein
MKIVIHPGVFLEAWNVGMKKPLANELARGLKKISAATYSPTQLPTQYHRR